MPIAVVDQHNVEKFVSYCQRYGREHDGSFLPGDDFAPDPDQPSYLLTDGGEVIGAVSLMRQPPYLAAGTGRFSVFHSLTPSVEVYGELLGAISKHFDQLEKVYLFIPRERREVMALLAELGFEPERITYVLSLSDPSQRLLELEPGFDIRSIGSGDISAVDEYADVLNEAFADSSGHIEIIGDQVRSWFHDRDHVRGGVLALYREGRIEGTVRVARDDGEAGSSLVEYLSVAASLRGRGLGRALLRRSINLSLERGFDHVWLSVSGANDSAIALYLDEGFTLQQSVVCMTKTV
jgi:mycothiol synthase